MDFIESLAQTLLSLGLIYGAVVAFRYWKTTVPPGAESDAQFANHPVVSSTRWLRLMNQQVNRNRRRRRRPLVDRRDHLLVQRLKLTHHGYSRS
jgi:hypothetical protein